MSVASSTIRKENLIVKHSSGATVIPTQVKDLGNGNYQYTISRDWNPTTDNGIWEIWTNENFRVLDDSGNPVATQKVGELSVALSGTSNLVVIVPWASLLNPSDTIISGNDPTDGEWKHWFKRLRNFDTWQMAVIHYVQIEKGNAWQMNEAVWRAMPTPAHDIATETSPGNFQITLQGGAVFRYETKRGLSPDGLEFPADVYIGAQTEYRDSAGDLIGGTARHQQIVAGSTALGIGRDDAPVDAVTVAIILIKPDNSQVRYRYPLQP
jgi:hypothetical protein